MPETLQTIGKEAFYNCQSLIKIDIPARVISIGSAICFQCLALLDAIIRTTSLDEDSKVILPEDAWFRRSNPNCNL